jgi:hypothetical protein
MAFWELRWNFNKETYQPGDIGTVSFYLENLSESPLFVSDIGIQFDWMGDKYYHIDVGNGYGSVITPKNTRFISVINFNIPKNMAGQSLYRVYYHLYEYDKTTDTWHDLGEMWSDEKYFINILPTPFYRAFVTRSLAPEDRALGDGIIKIIREWGIVPKTVEFNTKVSDTTLRETIKREIHGSDCLIAIATPRYMDALSGVWRTFEWLHGEIGIAFGRNYPILIIVDKRVALGGLPSTLREFSIEFDPYDYETTRKMIGAVMPALRDLIANKQWQEFVNTLGKIAVGVGLVLLGGAAGYLLGKSKR